MKLTFFLLVFLVFNLSAQTYTYYFGNLHSHTGFSDGCKDSSTSGVADPAGAYAYAKLSQNFDFLGISEHNHYSSNHNPGFKKPLYQKGMDMADTANKDASFLPWFGMEWGVSSDYNGHLLIYGFNQLIGWETSIPNVTGNNYDIFNAKTDYDGIFKKVKNNPNAFCFLAHPQTNDYTTNGNAATALSNAPYNADYDSAIVGTPLRNGVAFSTFTNYSDYPSGDYFSYYKKLLSIGYHLGMGYDHDNHNTTFGRNNAGRLVVLSPSLTRTDLTASIKKMRFYGSDDWNAKIDYTMNGNMMGSIVTGSAVPTFNIIHNDADGEQAKYIKIWKGTANTSGQGPLVVSSIQNNNTLTFTDLNLTQGREYYYFAEISQADGDWIVTSPIWYKSSAQIGTVGLAENTGEIKFNSFPNPITKNLNLSMDKMDEYSVSIMDLSGRTIYSTTCLCDESQVDLAAMNKGIYILKVNTKTSSVSKRLIIE